MVNVGYCWANGYNVKFKLKAGSYTNIIDFFNKNNISFLAELEINFNEVPINLRGKGRSYNLVQYLSNNNSDPSLINKFLNYYVSQIAKIKYSNGYKIFFAFSETSTDWHTMNFRVFDSNLNWTSTTTTTLEPTTTTTTTLEPTTTTTTTLYATTTMYATTTLEPTQQYAILVCMDGARFYETWESGSTYIPNLIKISQSGFTNTNMHTSVPSETNFGHCAMTTGLFEDIPNDGSVNPTYPTFMQEWLYNEGIVSSGDTDKAKMFFSKDKLYCLHQSSSLLNNYLPYVNAGVNGDGTGGYRSDAETHELFKTECLGENPPILSMISYREPDSYAHTGNYNDYVNSILQTDTYIGELWDIIQSHPKMSNNTTMFITNDHGRKDEIGGNDHGGDSESELHVMFFAIGPNIRNNIVDSTSRYLIDIPSTILKIFDIDKIYTSGTTMLEIFND